jgi:acyl-CoA dehydrogenase
MPMNVQPIAGVSDRINQIRLLTAEIVNKEILPVENQLWAWRRDGAVHESDKKRARELREGIQAKVKQAGLWAPHLPEEYGGCGLGFLEHAYMNEVLAYSVGAASLFGVVAPNSGNQKILLQYGTEEQKKKWLVPLTEGKLESGFSMTEPDQPGSDPRSLRTTARREGNEWVINGHKWFTSGAVGASIAIVMAVTDPEAAPHLRASMILVPTDTKGFNLVRPVSVMGHDSGGGHCEIRYEDCRVPITNALGPEGAGFLIAQARLGPGRIHHCMRAIGAAERAIEMMCRRANTRVAFGEPLAKKQFVQDMIATSRMEVDQARLLTLYAAWKMDTVGKREARQEISMIKVVAANVCMQVLDRAIQVHGALGVSDDTPLAGMWRGLRMLRLADGPDEVHKMVIARRELSRFK